MSDILYEGKSRIVYRGPGDESFILRYKDTATAFKKNTIVEFNYKVIR